MENKKDKNKKAGEGELAKVEPDFVNRYWEKSWTYIRTAVDVVHEPVLVLDEELHVMAANESFYRMFQVDQKDTEKKLVYELGNGQWDIPSLRELLEDILPENTFFKGFKVTHEFPSIGYKTMILNARQIFVKDDNEFPPIILLAIEDVTEMMDVAEMLAQHTNQFEAKTEEHIKVLGDYIEKLEKEIDELKDKPKNS